MKLLLALAGALVSSTAALGVEIEWVHVGDPGNVCDGDPGSIGNCFGAVHVEYLIGQFEVTNEQYTEFLNAVAATDTNALYRAEMGDTSEPSFGGIERSGVSSDFVYDTIPDRENMPVLVSFFSALRFANWLNNGQPIGAQDSTTTEDGAQNLDGAPTSTHRNDGAMVFLPRKSEWYKAAYYDTVARIYFEYPAASDGQTLCADPGSEPNTANCLGVDLVEVGSYTGSAGPNGTFDQGGNAYEWTNTFSGGGSTSRAIHGGDFIQGRAALRASVAVGANADLRRHGFRVASLVPEPSQNLLGMAALCSVLGIARYRRSRG